MLTAKLYIPGKPESLSCLDVCHGRFLDTAEDSSYLTAKYPHFSTVFGLWCLFLQAEWGFERAFPRQRRIVPLLRFFVYGSLLQKWCGS